MPEPTVKLPKIRVPGKLEVRMLERMERDHATAAERGFFFDEEEAERAVRFFEKYLVLWEGQWAGQPFLLAPFQKTNTREMFGWKRADSMARRFTNAYWEVARKAGKTNYAGGVGLKGLVQDNEPGSQCWFSATKRDQALIAFKAAAEMALQSPKLLKHIRVPKGYDRGSPITCSRLSGRLGVLGADHRTSDGLSPSTDIRDETHEWRGRSFASKLDTSKGSRRQPFTFEITTAGVYDPTAYGWMRHDYAVSVLNGVEDDGLFVYVACADEGDDPFDPATWWKANPGLGVTPKLGYMADMAAKARREPGFYNDFLRYHLNIWTAQQRRWLVPEDWAACDATPIDLEELRGRPCWAALDLSRKLDLTSLVLVFPEPDGGAILVAYFWIPEARVGPKLGRSEAEKTSYPTWIRDGWMVATPGNVVDYGQVRKKLNDLRAAGLSIQEIAYDPFNATQLVTELQEEDGFACVEFGQGFKSMSEPTKTFETLVVGHQLRTGGNPVMAWCAGNAVVSTDPAGNIKPDKSKAAEKIDGVVAAIMALGRSYAADADDEQGGSYLETHGMVHT